MKNIAMVAITLILCIPDAEAANSPVDLAQTCESTQGCERRLTENHEKLKIYLEQRDKKSLSKEQIKIKVKKSCSDLAARCPSTTTKSR